MNSIFLTWHARPATVPANMFSRFEELRGRAWSTPFSNSSLRKGMELFESGLVTSFTISADHSHISGFVPGTVADLEVEISIKIDQAGQRWINGDCDCQSGFNCKHVVAVILAALEEKPDLLGNGQAISGSTPRPPTPAKLRKDLLHWLNTLNKAAAPQQNAPVEAKHRLVYVLSIDANSSGAYLKLASYQIRIKKDGQFGATKRFYLSSAEGSLIPKFVSASDCQIARRLRPEWVRHYAHEITLPEDIDPQTLNMIIETGRCSWENCSNPPLKIGPPREAQPAWSTDSKGMQRPTFLPSPPATQILPLQPPWYADLTDNTVGPLNIQLPPAVAFRWLQAPAVSVVEAIDLNQVLARQLPNIALPRAKEIEIEQLPPSEPRPCLHFSAKRFQWWELNLSYNQAGLDGLAVYMAEVSFDYVGLRVIANAAGPATLEQFKNGKLQRGVRNVDSEKQLLQRLRQFDMLPVSEILHLTGNRNCHGAWTLRQVGANAWFKFSTETLPKLEAAGWIIDYAKDFDFRIATPTDWYGEVTPQTTNDWFGVELGVQIGAEKINLLPVLLAALHTNSQEFALAKLAKMPANRPVAVPLGDGRVLPFPAGRLHDILAVLVELYDPNSLGRGGRMSLPRLRAAELAALGEDQAWRWHGGDGLRELGLKLKNFRGIQRVESPAGLMATLRPYQLDGLGWLQFLREYSLSGILADDMGLGKTVQALAHLLAEKQSGLLDRPSLVVAPTTLMTNWRQEAERFAPSLRVLVSHGLERKQHFDKLPKFDLIVTSYSLLPRDADVLLGLEYHVVMLDEAQYIKNPKTKFAQVACQLKARHQLCLTGTPMENHLGELWSLFNFLMPGFLGDEHRFRTLFRNPIEKGQNKERREMLARRVGPFILRRRKEDVIKELPPKTEIIQNVELSGAQRDLYESIRLAMHAKVKAEVQGKGISRSHIIILDALLKLRQVCCDPRLVPLEPARHVQESAKLELLMDLLPEMIAEGRRILLFSQFTSMLELIKAEVAKLSIKFVKLTGETRDRATPVNHFQSGLVPLFLISLKAGGTGLNLTAADTVIHYDPWWNPAVENQATDRTHRIGQDKKVFVYKLMTVGTVEEKILALQSRKRELVDGLLNEERRDKLQLSAEDLDVLFAPVG